MTIEFPLFVYTHKIKDLNDGKNCTEFYKDIGFNASSGDITTLCHEPEFEDPLKTPRY